MEKSHPAPLVELPVFQGPLDLLLQLIQAEKVDIYDIPIARITEQFMRTLEKMGTLDMEVTSEFLVLAAHLLYIKSSLLLPKPLRPEESVSTEDPRQELVERLLSYRAYKEAAQWLSSLQGNTGRRYFREPDVEALTRQGRAGDPLAGVSFPDLWQAFGQVLARTEKGEGIEHLKPDEIALQVMLKDVWRRVLWHPRGIGFRRLLRTPDRLEAVVAFLAVLELLKDGRIRAEQSSSGNEIFLFPTAKAWEFAEEE
ncbi:segregation and condensation protein A [Peptococcaceae bacterium CEB3]|nr:segregation and condensation protein A [Peptococcaceae bacterium CEB3]